MLFAERLKELRAYKQCTQKQLAIFLGLTPNSVCEWENKRSEPSIETLLKISTYFDVSIDYLLGLEDDFGARTAAPVSDGLSSEERRLINQYRTLPDKIKKTIRDQIEIYSEPNELLFKSDKKV